MPSAAGIRWFAPELEFYLVEPNIDADYQLKPPIGRSGRSDRGGSPTALRRSTSSIRCSTTSTPSARRKDIEIDTLIHEDGPAQMEINLLHGDPLNLADQAFLFKRTARESGAAPQDVRDVHGQAARQEPGSAMHIHQSVVDRQTRANIFSSADGTPSALFFSHIAGLQRYLPAA